MSGVTAAITGAAMIGSSIINRNASRDASRASRQASEAELAFQAEQADRAREDVQNYIPAGMDMRNLRSQQAMDFLTQAMPLSTEAGMQGNQLAQAVGMMAAPQAANAILGGAPIDYSFLEPQRVNVNYSGLLGAAPNIAPQEPEPEPLTEREPLRGLILAGGGLGMDGGSGIRGLVDQALGGSLGGAGVSLVDRINNSYVSPPMISDPFNPDPWQLIGNDLSRLNEGK